MKQMSNIYVIVAKIKQSAPLAKNVSLTVMIPETQFWKDGRSADKAKKLKNYVYTTALLK